MSRTASPPRSAALLAGAALASAALIALGLGIAAFLPARIVHPWVTGTGWPQHMGGLFSVALLVVLARPRWWPGVLLGGALLGGLVELVQPYFGRGEQWSDLAGDVAGLAAGCGLGLVLRGLGTRGPRRRAG